MHQRVFTSEANAKKHFFECQLHRKQVVVVSWGPQNRGDVVVCMRKVLAIPRSCHVCFSALIGFCLYKTKT